MTSVNAVSFGQQVSPVAQQYYTKQAVPQYTTAPYQNDAFVSSSASPKKEKSGNALGKLIGTAALVVGGSVLARKFTPLKNYTKITENATLKQRCANIITTIADKSTEIGSKGIDKVKSLLGKITGKTAAETAEAAAKEAAEATKAAEEAAKNMKITPEQLITSNKKISKEAEFFINTYKPFKK